MLNGLASAVASQDVDEAMGPTAVIPGTHTAEAHQRFNDRDDGGRERVALLREQPNHVGVSARCCSCTASRTHTHLRVTEHNMGSKVLHDTRRLLVLASGRCCRRATPT